MVPAVVLGLLLCVQLCGGERRGGRGGKGWLRGRVSPG